MTGRRHHLSKKRLTEHLDKLERINKAEENQVIAEVAKIKRSHVRRYGRPKPVTNIPLKGLVSESDDSATSS